MANRKNEELRKKRVAELKRMKLLSKAKKEIEDLEKEIEHSKKVNIKIGVIRNLKISARVLQLIYPYVITAGIVSGVFIFCGQKPFYYGDKWKTYSRVKVDFDSDGNLNKQQQYASFGDYTETKSSLSYSTGWEKISDNFYSHTIYEYSFRNKTYNEVVGLFDKDPSQIEEVLGKPDSSIKETKNNLTEEELKKDHYCEAIVYYEDKNDYIMKTETKFENGVWTALDVIITIGVGAIVFKLRYENFDYEFMYYIRIIKSENELIDIPELNRKLENRKENYKTLTR